MRDSDGGGGGGELEGYEGGKEAERVDHFTSAEMRAHSV